MTSRNIVGRRPRTFRLSGFENFNNILDGVSASGVAYTPSMLLEISALKIVATAVCRNSGLVGGIYAPSLFLGAAVGSGSRRWHSAGKFKDVHLYQWCL